MEPTILPYKILSRNKLWKARRSTRPAPEPERACQTAGSPNTLYVSTSLARPLRTGWRASGTYASAAATAPKPSNEHQAPSPVRQRILRLPQHLSSRHTFDRRPMSGAVSRNTVPNRHRVRRLPYTSADQPEALMFVSAFASAGRSPVPKNAPAWSRCPASGEARVRSSRLARSLGRISRAVSVSVAFAFLVVMRGAFHSTRSSGTRTRISHSRSAHPKGVIDAMGRPSPVCEWNFRFHQGQGYCAPGVP